MDAITDATVPFVPKVQQILDLTYVLDVMKKNHVHLKRKNALLNAAVQRIAIVILLEVLATVFPHVNVLQHHHQMSVHLSQMIVSQNVVVLNVVTVMDLSACVMLMQCVLKFK